MANFLNPYSQTHAFDFIITFFQRLFTFLKGDLSYKQMASDELQIIILAAIASSSALIGVFLIYRKITMLANALSHSVLFGIAITFLLLRFSFSDFSSPLGFQILFITALITGFLTAFLSNFISKVSHLQKDAAIGLVFTTLFAAGILLISLFSRNAHIGIELVLGNVDTLHIQDLPNVLGLLAINTLTICLFFRGLKITTFDPVFAHLQGYSLGFYNILMIFLLSITSMGAFRAIGIVLVLSLLIVPPLIAKLYAQSLKMQLIFSVGSGVTASFLGVMISRHILTTTHTALSTGGITVCTLYTLYFLNWGGCELKKRLQKGSRIKETQSQFTLKT